MQSFTLPSLSRFLGDKSDNEGSVEQFKREFARHAQLSQWEGEVKRLQLKSIWLGEHYGCISHYLVT